MDLESTEEIKKPLAMKILVGFFFLFYWLAGFFSAVAVLLGTVFLIATCRISDLIFSYGMPVFFFFCCFFMRSKYRSGRYLQACLAMLPGCLVIFIICFRALKS